MDKPKESSQQQQYERIRELLRETPAMMRVRIYTSYSPQSESSVQTPPQVTER